MIPFKTYGSRRTRLIVIQFLSISKYIYLAYLMAFRYTWLPTFRVTSLSNLFSLITQAI